PRPAAPSPSRSPWSSDGWPNRASRYRGVVGVPQILTLDLRVRRGGPTARSRGMVEGCPHTRSPVGEATASRSRNRSFLHPLTRKLLGCSYSLLPGRGRRPP